MKNGWVIRQGKKSIEMQYNDLYSYQLDAIEEELVMACGLFIAAKIKKDLMILIPAILFIWTVLIIFWMKTAQIWATYWKRFLLLCLLFYF